MVELRRLRVVFHPQTPDERVALDDVDLKLSTGTFTVVVGTNGAGKSTLLNVIAGSVKPASGAVMIGVHDVTGWPVHRRARFVARVFQDPMTGTAPTLTIEENLALAHLRGGRRGLRLALNGKRRKAYRELLAPFGLGLENRLAAPVGLLSGGQRQVLALTMSTLARPDVLLLDEHTAALDPRIAELVMKASADLIRTHRLTALMVTHNMRHALDHGDRLLMMDDGRIKLDIDAKARKGMTVADLVRRFGDEADHVVLQAHRP
jgi:putative tryptophan/tyrosine transport system ATP-binding protein